MTIRTKLILPVIPPDTDPLNPLPSFDEIQDDKPRYPLSVSHLSQHDTEQGLEDAEKEKTHSRASGGRSSSSPPDLIVVRIEVEDTGYGIKQGDMHKLFSEFEVYVGQWTTLKVVLSFLFQRHSIRQNKGGNKVSKLSR